MMEIGEAIARGGKDDNKVFSKKQKYFVEIYIKILDIHEQLQV
jgi:hypothetical protein